MHAQLYLYYAQVSPLQANEIMSQVLLLYNCSLRVHWVSE